MKFLKIVVVVLIFGFAVYKRLPYFPQISKDIYAYQRAIEDLFAGKNPYEWTIESYSNPDDPGNHGYAYLPGLLYVNAVLYVCALLTKVPYQILWKIPVLLADLGVGFLLLKKFWPKSYFLALVSCTAWFFNPYSVARTGYTYSEPLVILFMFLALIYLQKDDVLSGVFYTLSIIFKTFPIILLPIFLFKSKDKLKFLVTCIIVGLFFAIPFMRSGSDFITFLKGSLFVHNERFVQGRPFLFYISYFYNIEFFQIIPFKFYSMVSIFGGWLVSILMYFAFKVKDKYLLSLASFACFYLFTPVLNRTYLIWFLPVLIIACYAIATKIVRKPMFQKVLMFFMLGSYYVFYYWYLVQWEDGFHIWHP